ncbi:hypothetical protein [Streptomyces sp. NPDC017940]|uniref:hypothetical protein n=1 Tax=Streptomyces sp. NPDC017940 TaxID=3365017 RepID=UPI0037AFE7CE
MATSGARIRVGAVQAAWDQVCVLRSAEDLERVSALADRIAKATALYGTDEVARGTVALIGGAVDLLGAGRPGGAGFTERFIDKLMNKIVKQWPEQVDAADLPMVRQVVTVAFEDRDPVAWRDAAGAVPDSERIAMGCALALIADFVDFVNGPGACERALLTALGGALD